MVIYGSYMFEFSVNKKLASPMKFMLDMNGGGSRESSGSFMSNTNYQGIKN